MTWNVENLFDVGDDDGPKTQAQFAAKIESLRAVIDAQRPHVLTLQEVGSESALAKLQAALEHKLPHRAVAEPDERGIRVAIISRRVLHDPAEIRPFPSGLLPVQVGDDPPGPDGPRMMNQMGRGALQVTVRANNRDVHIITAHLKSKLLTFPDEAVVVPGHGPETTIGIERRFGFSGRTLLPRSVPHTRRRQGHGHRSSI